MEKSCRKCASEASPRPYFILVNNPKQPFLKKGTLFSFPTQSILMDKVAKNKKGLKLVTSPSLSYKISSKKFIH